MSTAAKKVNNEMGATETEKATQGAATSSAGTARKVTPPTLAQQWEELAGRFENYAIEMSEEASAQIALEIRRAVRDGLDLSRLAGAVSRIHEDTFSLVKGVTESSPFAGQIATVMDDIALAVHLLHETTQAQRPPAAQAPDAGSSARPYGIEHSAHESLLLLASAVSEVGCNAYDDEATTTALPEAYAEGMHAIASEHELSLKHRSARGGAVIFASAAARVFAARADHFEGTKRDVMALRELLRLVEGIHAVTRKVLDAAETAEASK